MRVSPSPSLSPSPLMVQSLPLMVMYEVIMGRVADSLSVLVGEGMLMMSAPASPAPSVPAAQLPTSVVAPLASLMACASVQLSPTVIVPAWT